MDLGISIGGDLRRLEALARQAEDAGFESVWVAETARSVFVQAALAVRGVALELRPGLRPALAELSGKISTEAMRKMNYEVDGQHRAVRDVARDFLSALTFR